MTSIGNEKIIDYLVVSHIPDRRFTAENDTRWGGLIEPAPSENADKTDAGLRVALFASWDFGYLMLETLKKFENKYPDQLNLVGLVTDHPLSPDAKISLKKRIWNLLDMPYRVIDETFIIEAGLSHGIPVYTGEVKVESFHHLLEKWKPDVILVCVFGQIIDSFTLNMPPYGIYNFHPSDLSKNQGAGTAPYNDLMLRKAKTGVWSVHYVSEDIDCGPIVGISPQVNILDVKGELPADPVVVYHKMAEILSPMAFILVKEMVSNFGLSKPGRINSVDFESLIPDGIKTKIMQPIIGDPWTEGLSIPDDFLFNPG